MAIGEKRWESAAAAATAAPVATREKLSSLPVRLGCGAGLDLDSPSTWHQRKPKLKPKSSPRQTRARARAGEVNPPCSCRGMGCSLRAGSCRSCRVLLSARGGCGDHHHRSSLRRGPVQSQGVCGSRNDHRSSIAGDNNNRSVLKIFSSVLLLAACALVAPLSVEAGCAGKIDLVICLDASGSIAAGEWTQQTDFVKQFVLEFSNNGDNFKGEDGLKIGVMHFASGNTIVTNPPLTSSKTNIYSALGSKKDGGGTQTHLCLQAAHQLLDGSSNGARDNASKVILLITDGAPSNEASAISEAANAKSKKITVVGVGVDTSSIPPSGDFKKPSECSTPKKCLSDGDLLIMNLVTPPTGCTTCDSDCDSTGTDSCCRKCDNFFGIGDFSSLAASLQSLQEAVCPVDCLGEWGKWSACDSSTGKQTRKFTVTSQALDGGKECPAVETRTCAVDCVYAWSQWSSCAALSPPANVGPFHQKRAAIVSRHPLNGGNACPAPETRPCVPNICYSVTSTAPGFAEIKNLRIITKLPLAHPAVGRTKCPLSNREIPFSDCADHAHQNSAALFYSYDGATKKARSTLAERRKGRYYFIVDKDGRGTHFVYQNGDPGASSYIDHNFVFDSDPAQAPLSLTQMVNMSVRDEPEIPGCGLSDSCYSRWNAASRQGTITWRWGDKETSGGAFGPLPAWGYCVNLAIQDYSGIDSFEVLDYYEPAASGSDFVKSHEISSMALGGAGVRLCVKTCQSGGSSSPPTAPSPQSGASPSPTPSSSSGTRTGSSTASTSPSPRAPVETTEDVADVRKEYDSCLAANGGDKDACKEQGGLLDQVKSDVADRLKDQNDVVDESQTRLDECEAANPDDTSPCAPLADQLKKDKDKHQQLKEMLVATQTPADLPNAANEGDSGSSEGGGGVEAGTVMGVIVGVIFVGVLAGLLLAFAIKKRKAKKKSQGELEDGWKEELDKESGTHYYVHTSGKTTWNKPVRKEEVTAVAIAGNSNPMQSKHARLDTVLPDGWEKECDKDGNKFYSNQNTGESTWEAPPGSTGGSEETIAQHSRSNTALPVGWSREYDEEGNKYYSKPDGTTQWERPPGN